MLVRNESVRIVDLVPALFGGFRFRSVEDQGADDWPKMSEKAILAFKAANADACDRFCEQDQRLMDKIAALPVGRLPSED